MPDSSKIEIISKSLDTLVTKLSENPTSHDSMWTTIIPLLIGASLTLITQLLIELYKLNREKTNKKQELISKGKAKTYLIVQISKDLIMYKVHKQYYLRAFNLETDPVEKADDNKKHYEKGQEQRMTESRLDEAVADYFQIVTEYIVVTKSKFNFQSLFDSIFNYNHPKASKFMNCNTMHELVVELDIEEQRLNTDNDRFVNYFKTIQSGMM